MSRKWQVVSSGPPHFRACIPHRASPLQTGSMLRRRVSCHIVCRSEHSLPRSLSHTPDTGAREKPVGLMLVQSRDSLQSTVSRASWHRLGGSSLAIAFRRSDAIQRSPAPSVRCRRKPLDNPKVPPMIHEASAEVADGQRSEAIFRNQHGSAWNVSNWVSFHGFDTFKTIMLFQEPEVDG